MSEEEKQAIEQLKSWREYIVNHRDSVNKANDIEFYLRTALNLIEKQQKEIEEIRQWKYTIDTYEDLDKLKELDLIKIKGKKYIAENRLQEFKDLLLKELDRDFVTKEYRQAINCYFKKILEGDK